MILKFQFTVTEIETEREITKQTRSLENTNIDTRTDLNQLSARMAF